MNNISYFSTLKPEQKRILQLQGSCNQDNARIERRIQIAQAEGAKQRIKDIWNNFGKVTLQVEWPKENAKIKLDKPAFTK
jgi:hypothetical protein